MKHVKILAAATAACLGIAAPALADYVRIGSVDVSSRPDHDTAYSRFGGRVEGLRLVADRSDIFCRAVTVRYANGQTDTVFHGPLREGRPVFVDVRGRAKRIDSIHFACKAEARRGGRIYVSAEVGRYRDEWRHDRDWDRHWSGMFGPGTPPPPPPHRYGGPGGNWVVISRESFEGRHDREGAFAGWTGRQVDRIGLRPANADASCSRVTVFFRNGHRKDLNTGPTRFMRRGQMVVLDLPGGDRDVTKLSLSCRALNRNQVTIEILGRK